MKKIGIVGLGRVGTLMAYLLAERDHEVKVVLSSASRENYAQVEHHHLPIGTLEEIAQETDLLLITTPDGVIPKIVEKLAKMENLPCTGVFHLSGSHSPAVLAPLREKGISVGSFHPLQSIARLQEGLKNLPGTSFTFSGDKVLIPWVTSFTESINCRLLIAPDDLNQILYHGGASIVSNFLVILTQMGIDCLTEAGFSPAQAQQALLPLMEGTLNNLRHLPPEKALTGPIVRGDVTTIKNHIEELAKLEEKQPHLLPSYIALGSTAATMAYKNGFLQPAQFDDILATMKIGGA